MAREVYEYLRKLEPHGKDRDGIMSADVFDVLKGFPGGLTSVEAERRLVELWPNKLPEEQRSKTLKFLRFLWNPLAWLLELAAIMSWTLLTRKAWDWYVFVGIVALLIINSAIGYFQESMSYNVATNLKARLCLKSIVRRDGSWLEIDASHLVIGDVICIMRGNIVPADVRLIRGSPFRIDQSALTGEPFDMIKEPGEIVYLGSICKQGVMEAIVCATGQKIHYREVDHLAVSIDRHGHFQKVLVAIGKFCISAIILGMLVEGMVIYTIQKRSCRSGISNLLVLLIGGVPISMPTVLYDIMAIGSKRLSQQGAITKRMEAIEEMASMDVLFIDIIGTLTANKPVIETPDVESFDGDVNSVTMMANIAAQMEDPVDLNVQITHILQATNEAAGDEIRRMGPFYCCYAEKYTCVTYLEHDNSIHQVCKGPLEDVLKLVDDMTKIQVKYDAALNKFAERGYLSVAVASKAPFAAWKFLGLVPLKYSLRENSANTIKRAFDMGLEVKMFTGDQLTTTKKMGLGLKMGDNWHTSAALLRQGDSSLLHTNDFIEKAAGFAMVLPGHKYEIVKRLQSRNHICGMTGCGVDDAPALKIADVGIAVPNATDTARDASGIVLTEPGLIVILNAVLTSRAILNGMKSYMIFAISITIRNVLGFMLLALIWKFDFPPFMVLIITFLSSGIVMTVSRDKAKPSHLPDSWKLREIFTTGIVLGMYLALVTVVFFWVASETKIFHHLFGVGTLQSEPKKLASAVFLLVSITSQGLIFVTRASIWSFLDRPGLLIFLSFGITQAVATLIAMLANWDFAAIHGIGLKWAGIVWLYSLVSYIPLYMIRLLVQYAMVGKGWDYLVCLKDELMMFIGLLCQD